MNDSANRWIFVGALFGFFSVALGAFGAHALASHLTEKSLTIYHTAVQYQMFHSTALIAFGIFESRATLATRFTKLAGWFFTSGILLFSGSLYLLALTEVRALGMITPIGGVSFLLGWVAFALAARGAAKA